MNIFRFIEDHDSLINVLVLLLKIYITKSWSGVSLKTEELYAMVLLARYLDLCGGHPAISHGIGLKVQLKQDDLLQVLEPHLGSIVVTAMVRGVTMALTVPMNLSLVWSSLQHQLQENNGAWGLICHSLFNGLVKECEILGSIRVGVHWTPIVFANCQRDSVDSLFSQIVSTKALRRCPEGVPLDTVFIQPSLIDMLDSAAEDAIKCRHLKMRLYCNHEEEAASISDEEMLDGDANIDDEEMVDGDANIGDEMVDANIDDEDEEMVDANIDDEDEEMVDANIDD
ncbi:hypothetical protein Sjap_022065 [Stephania japonica]|uniref:E3 UFM1-protein ligase 1-like N-terminal domain-containing protein n=1 Tax=Stephania japonica TaxID=461633 RepID=A0AAP0HPJ0_9MAGN